MDPLRFVDWSKLNRWFRTMSWCCVMLLILIILMNVIPADHASNAHLTHIPLAR